MPYSKKPISPEIIHFKKINEEGKARYYCLGVCDTFPQKLTEDWDKVTCKNCLSRFKPEDLPPQKQFKSV